MHIFEKKDKTGRIIYLSSERFKHIQKHLESIEQLEELKETLINPDKIIEFEFDNNVRFYFRFNKAKKAYLFISVKYLNGTGFIITSFYTDKIK